jgi:hypothetical protein
MHPTTKNSNFGCMFLYLNEIIYEYTNQNKLNLIENLFKKYS